MKTSEMVREGATLLYSDGRRRGREIEESRHEGMVEVYQVVRGTGLYLIGSRTYEVDEGDVIFISDGMVHKTIEGDAYHETRGFTCPSYYIPERIKEILRENGPIFRCRTLLPVLQTIFEKIKVESMEEASYYDEMLRCYVNEMIIFLARAKNDYHSDNNVSPAVAIALSYVRDHAQERITLQDAAEAADVSVAYLSRRFKTDVGVGFAEYLSRQRLERATRMLREHPEMSVTEIAFSSGFNDSNYFSDKFKREFGVSPLKFRRMR